MLTYDPFLITSLAFGIIGLVIFLASNIIFMIPVMATRGTAQLLWFVGMGGLITIELVVLVTLGILVRNGTIW
jgi:hypothetical protein